MTINKFCLRKPYNDLSVVIEFNAFTNLAFMYSKFSRSFWNGS